MKLLSVFVLLSLLVACTPPAANPDPMQGSSSSSVEESAESSVSSDTSDSSTSESSSLDSSSSESSSSSEESHAYIDATADVSIALEAVKSGKPVLLFFSAPWCGFCQAKDALLKRLYGENAYAISTYKVDYDTAAQLKATYGVTAQDTVVLVDAEGKAIATIAGATQSQIEAVIAQGESL